jgi:two-component system LytT family sensor kinase
MLSSPDRPTGGGRPVAPSWEVGLLAELPVPKRTAWPVALGLWTLVAVSYALTLEMSAAGDGVALPWDRALAWTLPSFYLWMVLTPVIARLGRRTAGRGKVRFLAVHAPASVLLAVLHAAVFFVVFWWLMGPRGRYATLSDLVRLNAADEVHLGLLIYWTVLAVLRGIDAQRGLAAEQARASRLAAELAETRLQVLRTQLQPHFLFNTLNAISALALDDPHLARAMIARLGDFLRLTLAESGREELPLARELQGLECYLEIQRLRFQDRLAVQLNVAPEALAAVVPHLLLQPLVENAFQHGLSPRPGAGRLTVSGRRQGADLLLVVEDDGLGLPAGGPREGFGLANTRDRLRVRFGDAAGLALEARPGGGTRAALRLPYLEAPAPA